MMVDCRSDPVLVNLMWTDSRRTPSLSFVFDMKSIKFCDEGKQEASASHELSGEINLLLNK